MMDKRKSKIKNLSGGEKQRVAIARALIKSPKVMLCDEPTASLNTAKGIQIIELITKLHKEQDNTLLVVTHDDRLTGYFDNTLNIMDLLGGGRYV
jgi:putative ABC transport system ATP-binding protein